MTSTEKRKPIHEIRMGLVKAAIWSNVGEKGTRYGVTFARMFKQEAKPWRFSDSFGRDDLPVLAALASEAHRWILAQTSTASEAKEAQAS